MSLRMWEWYGIDVSPYLELEAWSDHRPDLVHSRVQCSERIHPPYGSSGPKKTQLEHALCPRCYQYTLPASLAAETVERGGFLLDRVMRLREKAHSDGVTSKGFRDACEAMRLLREHQDLTWAQQQTAELIADVQEDSTPERRAQQLSRLLGDWEPSGREALLRIAPAHVDATLEVLTVTDIATIGLWWRPEPGDGACVVRGPEEVVLYLNTRIRTALYSGRGVSTAPLEATDTAAHIETALHLLDERSKKLSTLRGALEAARAVQS